MSVFRTFAIQNESVDGRWTILTKRIFRTSAVLLKRRVFQKERRRFPVSVDGERYRGKLIDFVCPEIDDPNLDDVCFHGTIDLLRTRFGNRVASRRFGDVG